MGNDFNPVAFDLETIADREILKQLGTPEVKLGNTKDPEKIKQKEQDALIKYIRDAGMNPHHNMVCLFTYCDVEGKSGHVLLQEESAEAEKDLLLKAWDILAGYKHFVTFNGIEFDIPVMMLHSLFRRVRPTVKISTKKYTITNHTDLRMVLGNWDKMAPGKLDFYLRRCTDSAKMEGVDGSMVQHLWDDDMKDIILEYGVKDAQDTMDLYKIVKEYYLI